MVLLPYNCVPLAHHQALESRLPPPAALVLFYGCGPARWHHLSARPLPAAELYSIDRLEMPTWHSMSPDTVDLTQERARVVVEVRGEAAQE